MMTPSVVGKQTGVERKITVVLPILPGKSEAWRRFMQALQGTRRDEFADWCTRMQVRVAEIWLHELLGGTAVVFQLHIAQPDTVVTQWMQPARPFDRWLDEQILFLIGLDLSRMAQSAYNHWRKTP
jgi:hypothetical protein